MPGKRESMTTFCRRLVTSARARKAYQADPEGFVDASGLSPKEKAAMKTKCLDDAKALLPRGAATVVISHCGVDPKCRHARCRAFYQELANLEAGR